MFWKLETRLKIYLNMFIEEFEYIEYAGSWTVTMHVLAHGHFHTTTPANSHP